MPLKLESERRDFFILSELGPCGEVQELMGSTAV